MADVENLRTAVFFLLVLIVFIVFFFLQGNIARFMHKKHWIVDRLIQRQMRSHFIFDSERSSKTDINQSFPSEKKWPWGAHHTEHLGHLEAAAKRYWVNYDPSDATTASTNATVSEWLQTERKVSRTMADSIASMLRPDGLPTGPRK